MVASSHVAYSHSQQPGRLERALGRLAFAILRPIIDRRLGYVESLAGVVLEINTGEEVRKVLRQKVIIGLYRLGPDGEKYVRNLQKLFIFRRDACWWIEHEHVMMMGELPERLVSRLAAKAQHIPARMLEAPVGPDRDYDSF